MFFLISPLSFPLSLSYLFFSLKKVFFMIDLKFLFLLLVYLFALADNPRVSVLEPLDGISLGETVVDADAARGALALVDAHAGTLKDDVEVHAVDANLRIVLDAEVDVLLDAKAKVARGAEVVLGELILLDLEALLEDLSSLCTTDGGVDGDLLISADAESSHSVSGYKKIKMT